MNTYTLPQSSYYKTDYSPITFNLDEVIRIGRVGTTTLKIIKKNELTIYVRYLDEFEVDLIIADIENKIKAFKESG